MSREYLTENNEWSRDHFKARDFPSTIHAWEYCNFEGLENYEILIKFEEDRYDLTSGETESITFAVNFPAMHSVIVKEGAILIGDDSPDDVLLLTHALKELQVTNPIRTVSNLSAENLRTCS